MGVGELGSKVSVNKAGLSKTGCLWCRSCVAGVCSAATTSWCDDVSQTMVKAGQYVHKQLYLRMDTGCNMGVVQLFMSASKLLLVCRVHKSWICYHIRI
jgi:hypothetical protein